MDQNFRQRRRSNLGRRRLTNGENAHRILPVFPVLTVRGLGLSSSRSGKKSHKKLDKASSSYNLTKKQLFLNKSPLAVSGSATSVEDLYGTSSKRLCNSPLNYSSSVHDSSSLNITGISSIEKSPSPDSKHAMSTSARPYYNYTTSLLTGPYERKTSHKKLCFAEEVFGKLEPPKSPGPSKYNQLILKELADLKPPVDPDDLLPIKSMALEDDATPFRIPGRLFTSTAIKNEATGESLLSFKNNRSSFTVVEQKPTVSDSITEEPSILSQKNVKKSLEVPEDVSIKDYTQESTTRKSLVFSPHLSSTYIGSVSPSPNIKLNFSCVSGSKRKETDKKLSVINEDLDSTDSFLMAEQTVIVQNNTITHSTNSKGVSSQPIQYCATDKGPTFEESEIDSDTELDQVLQNIDDMLKQMGTLRKTVENMKHKQRCKKNNNLNNKENIPETKSRGEIKWMNNLKSHNPGLLKTPKMAKNSRLSLMNHSAIWTPHSLSTVLHEQVEDLFD